MSELDKSISDSINDVAHEENSQGRHRTRQKPDAKKHNHLATWLLAGLLIVALLQLNNLRNWIFGVPDATVQADIITLLKHTDEKLQDIQVITGEIPTALPADTPPWLVGYKKTLAGYKISTEMNGVKVELERNQGVVQITEP